jgi:hypothetical protein
MIKKMIFSSIIVALVFCVSSCISTEEVTYIKVKPYQQLPNPTHDALKKFMNNPDNKGCAVVVRDLTTNIGNLTSGENTRICALLERGLLEQGYKPRDRKLFQTVVDKMGENINYKSIHDKTGVDLIFEITQSEKNTYNVGSYYTKEIGGTNHNVWNTSAWKLIMEKANSGGEWEHDFERTVADPNRRNKTINIKESYIFYGFTVEIRVILVQDALIGGIYKYTYTPCSAENGGCIIKDWNPSLDYLTYFPNDPFMTADLDRVETSKDQLFGDNLVSQFFSNVLMPMLFIEMKGE